MTEGIDSDSCDIGAIMMVIGVIMTAQCRPNVGRIGGGRGVVNAGAAAHPTQGMGSFMAGLRADGLEGGWKGTLARPLACLAGTLVILRFMRFCFFTLWNSVYNCV